MEALAAILKRSHLLAAIAVMPLFAACDPVTYGEVVVQSSNPLDPECFTRVEEQLRAEGGVDVTGSLATSGQVQIARGSARITVFIETSSPTMLTLSFKWLGRSAAEDERDRFALLDQSQALLQRNCAVKESDISVRRRCSARLCDKWLDEHGERT